MFMAKVLLAENDANWSGLEIMALEQAGHSVASVASAKGAIDYLTGNFPDIVITDLHMGGDNGDDILEYILLNRTQMPLVIASGTLSDTAKMIIAQGIPSMFLFSKEDFLNPHYISQKIRHILENPFPHLPSQFYLDIVRKAKAEIDSIPDISVEVDKIKGKIFALINHYRGNELNDDDYASLKEYSYYGSAVDQT